jgi:hypothetical protein
MDEWPTPKTTWWVVACLATAGGLPDKNRTLDDGRDGCDGHCWQKSIAWVWRKNKLPGKQSSGTKLVARAKNANHCAASHRQCAGQLAIVVGRFVHTR